ncbi:oligosaccharide flippase family protein [Methylocystis echinoides]|uniref:lipopolysaccharide biosynthesis protein n=1 Tax=Methylocystis echinoides TaxID=29468 RepID=UPI003441AC1F
MRARVSALIDQLKSQRAAFGAIVAMSIKAAGALMTLAVFTLAARAMTADDFGSLAIWFNAVGFLAVAAVFGQDTLIARSFGEYAGRSDYARAWGAYRFGWTLTLVSGVLFAATMVVCAPLFFPGVANTVLLSAAFFLLTQTILHYSSHSARAVVGVLVSEASRELIWRAILLAAVVWGAFHQGLTRAEFFVIAGVGQLLSLAFASVSVWRVCRKQEAPAASYADRSKWLSRSLPMWQSAMLEAASMYFDVLLIGYVASPAAAGDYFAAARIANVFLMALTGLNTVTVARSASLYFSGNAQKLQELLRSIALVSTAMLAPLLLLIYIFGGQFLTLFGARYAADYLTLVILATGCFVMSTCGSASVVLLTTGQEKLYSRIIAGATFARVALTGLLAWRFGAPGAAAGWTLVNVPLFMLLSAICYRKIGVDPSILSLLSPLRERMRASSQVAGRAQTGADMNF